MTVLTVLLLSRREHPAEQYFPAFIMKKRQKLGGKEELLFFYISFGDVLFMQISHSFLQ